MTMKWELRKLPRRSSEWQKTQPLVGSSYTLGDRQDRVLTIDAGNVKITSISVPENHVTLTTKRWARFLSIREEVDIKAREVNHQTHPVAYCDRDRWVWICWHSSFLCSIRTCKGERPSYPQWNWSLPWRMGTSIRTLADYSGTASRVESQRWIEQGKKKTVNKQ